MKLTLEQELTQRKFADDVARMNVDELRALVLEMSRSYAMQTNGRNELLRKKWGIT